MHSREADRLRRKMLKDIQDEADHKKSDPNFLPSHALTIQYIMFQKIHPVVSKMIKEHYSHIKKININNCDLRTFQNFPLLPNLLEINASNNSMRGSFEFIVKNRSINYIDVSDNIIVDIQRFEPLRMLKDLSIYAKGNPCFTSKTNAQLSGKDSFTGKLKSFGVTLLKEARKQTAEEKSEEKANEGEKKKEEKINEKIQFQEPLFRGKRGRQQSDDLERYLVLAFESDEDIMPFRRSLENSGKSRRMQERERILQWQKEREKERRLERERAIIQELQQRQERQERERQGRQDAVIIRAQDLSFSSYLGQDEDNEENEEEQDEDGDEMLEELSEDMEMFEEHSNDEDLEEDSGPIL